MRSSELGLALNGICSKSRSSSRAPDSAPSATASTSAVSRSNFFTPALMPSSCAFVVADPHESAGTWSLRKLLDAGAGEKGLQGGTRLGAIGAALGAHCHHRRKRIADQGIHPVPQLRGEGHHEDSSPDLITPPDERAVPDGISDLGLTKHLVCGCDRLLAAVPEVRAK